MGDVRFVPELRKNLILLGRLILLTMAFLQRISEVNKVSIVITQGTKESLYKLIEQLVRGTALPLRIG